MPGAPRGGFSDVYSRNSLGKILLALSRLRGANYPDCLIESKLLDILPSSLETLMIIYCTFLIIPKLLEMADTHDSPFPRLKTVTIRIHKLSDLQEFDHLQPAFARIGVEFRCIYTSVYDFSSSESSEYDSTEELEEDSKREETL